MKKIALILATILLIALAACAAPASSKKQLENATGVETVGIDVSDVKISLEIDINGSKKTFTQDDFKNIKFTKFETITNEDNGEASKKTKYTAINLKDILSYYKVDRYSKIVLENEKGETYEAKKDSVDFGIYLAFQKDNKTLAGDLGPVLAIPSTEKSSSYVSNCTKISIYS